MKHVIEHFIIKPFDLLDILNKDYISYTYFRNINFKHKMKRLQIQRKHVN